MNSWTKEQEQAIRARHSNLLVAAAAGSGKTAVLVERIIQIISQEEVDIDRLLIVTFTNAAAGEMRERISNAIIARLDAGEEDNEHLRRQLPLLNRTSISTLHAFCTEIVREYFHLLDIDPKFRIGDATECELMKLESVEELLEEEYERGEAAFLGLVDRFAGSKYDTPVQDMLLKTYDFIQSQPDPQGWLDKKVGEFDLDEDELADSLWIQSLGRDVQNQIDAARELFSQALKLIDLDPGLEGYRPALSDDLQLTGELANSLQAGFRSLFERLPSVSYTRLGRVSKDCDPYLQAQVKELREEGKDLIKGLQPLGLGKSLADYAEDLRELYPYMQALAELINKFSRRYQEKKAEKGLLDFNDLEHYALNILGHPEAAQAYRDKYEYIFVDEYQDSNLVQETLLNYIKRDDNLFMVGDVKQSIYRFRLADPSLFIGKYHSFGVDETDLNRRIDLGMNFRSRAEIISGANYIFKQIMSLDLGEIDYDERAFLNCGCSMEEAEDACIEILLIEKDSELLELDEESEDLSDVEIEASFAARRIKELVGQPVYDPRLKTVRPLDYRDIVILMRSTVRRADSFMEVFARQGIPVYADVNQGYFEALEVEMFLNLLRIIDNKRQDIPLLSVLRSPIGKFKVEDLITVRLASQSLTFYGAMEEYINTQTDELAQRLAEFWSCLGRWKDQSRYLPIDEFIWQVMAETGYYYYVGAMPGGIQRQANLRILFERARQFQGTALKGLFNFIKFVDKLKTSSGDMGMARVLGENDNVVRIMSIHKSKGLEFPVVILAGMGKQFNFSDTNANVLFHKDLGIGPRYVDPEARISYDTIPRIAMKNRIKMESLSEEMRILYVACTRPINKLIMLGSYRNIPGLAGKWSKPLPYGLNKAKTCLDWIGPVIIRHPDGESLRDLIALEAGWEEILPDESKWKVEILSPSLLGKQEKEIQEHQNTVLQKLQNFNHNENTAFKELIAQRLDWHYQYPAAEKIPSKLSVSGIKKLQAGKWAADYIEPPAMLSGPEFISNAESHAGRSLTGAERGTVMHFVMQHLDMNRVSSPAEIEDQLQEMLLHELLTEEEIKSVQTDKIRRFFQTELGRRLLQSPAINREVPFNLVYKASQVLEGIEDCDEELLIQGVIDLYFREDDELVLVDYKTDYISPQNRTRLIQQYSVQVKLYQQALEKILGSKVKESYLYLFHTEEMVRI